MSKEEKNIENPPKEEKKACKQLTDGLVNEILIFEASKTKRGLCCVTKLHLLRKLRMNQLSIHGITLYSYPNIRWSSQSVLMIICSVAEILKDIAIGLQQNVGIFFQFLFIINAIYESFSFSALYACAFFTHVLTHVHCTAY